MVPISHGILPTAQCDHCDGRVGDLFGNDDVFKGMHDNAAFACGDCFSKKNSANDSRNI